ncbi:hypothetical protein [Nostoc sp. UHCC 0252]|uniref:hypothetical protein n=1 Tax=Nostoc sp. UHCC 0252 TaxID=3110241 RepID=UPI002B220434|nr:hypothetical protein [Nostoc sp. UHCC 0252]MEA5602045.1 hypothetical protein [Nostoc sp. UHCC 0252]
MASETPAPQKIIFLSNILLQLNDWDRGKKNSLSLSSPPALPSAISLKYPILNIKKF